MCEFLSERDSMKKVISLALIFALVLSMLVTNSFALTMTTTDKVYLWPVPQSTFITSYCGDYGHLGIDITTIYSDTEVVATLDGTVLTARSTDCEHINGYGVDKCNGGCGNYVVIQHDDGSLSRYYHLKYDTVCVTAGQRVKAGDKIGIMGSSGNSTGTHLHYELRDPDIVLINNSPENIDYVFKAEDLNAKMEYELWQLTAAYNIRSAPSVNAQKVGSASNHTFVAVTDWVVAEGITWAKVLFTAPSTADYKDCYIAIDGEKFIKSVSIENGVGKNVGGGSKIPVDSDSDSDSDTSTDKTTDTSTDTATDTEPKPTLVNELWLIDKDTNLRVRSGAGLSFDTVGWLKGSEIVLVKNIVSADGYIWGQIESVNFDKALNGKWCSLNYAKKVGDVNSDSQTDILDLVRLRGYVTGEIKFDTSQFTSGDINGDVKIDVIDLSLMRKFLVNK